MRDREPPHLLEPVEVTPYLGVGTPVHEQLHKLEVPLAATVSISLPRQRLASCLNMGKCKPAEPLARSIEEHRKGSHLLTRPVKRRAAHPALQQGTHCSDNATL